MVVSADNGGRGRGAAGGGRTRNVGLARLGWLGWLGWLARLVWLGWLGWRLVGRCEVER